MSEMIERVEKAMREADVMSTARRYPDRPIDEIRALAAECSLDYAVMARAAIEAMREPTEQMCDEGAKEHRWGYGAYDAEVTWKHMITAALKEKHDE
jgi:hypothetical protein